MVRSSLRGGDIAGRIHGSGKKLDSEHDIADIQSKRVILVGNPVIKTSGEENEKERNTPQERQTDDVSSVYMNDFRESSCATPAITFTASKSIIDLTAKGAGPVGERKANPAETSVSSNWGWPFSWLGESSANTAKTSPSSTSSISTDQQAMTLRKEDDAVPVKTKEVIDLTGATVPENNVEPEQKRIPLTSPPTAEAKASYNSSWSSWFSWSTPSTSSAAAAVLADEKVAVDEDKGHDDDSMTEASAQHLFADFEDLNSIPSVMDATVTGDSLHSADFDGRDDGSTARHLAVEQKLEELVTARSNARSSVSDLPVMKDKIVFEGTLQTRRQHLIKELQKSILHYGRYDVKCAAISAALGDVLNEAGEYEQAIKLHKDAVSIYTVKLGDNSETTIDAKVKLGLVLINAKDYDEALDYFWAVTVMRKALHGEKEPLVADGLSLMADCLRRNAEYQQAIKELKRALKIYRQTLGDSHVKVAKTVDDIASLYVTLGDFEKSSAILEEVVKLKAATQGMKSKAVAETLLTLAMTYECSEQFTQAMKTLKKAYKIYTEVSGYSSEAATTTLNKIAMLYEATGDFSRASIAYLGVLRGRKIHLGEDNLLVGETYCKLGHALRETGQYDKALKCMKEALPIFVGSGVELQDVEKIADIMSEMALIYKEKKHFSESARIFKQELSVRRKIGQPEFPLIARNLNNLGVIEYEMKNNSRALKYFVEALTICQEKGEHGMDCAEILFNTGLVFAAVRNKERALEALTEALRLFTEHGCKDTHPNVINANKEISKITLSSARSK